MSDGKLTVYYGCMFAGKTTALINHIEGTGLKPHEVLVFKPHVDNRSSHNIIATHSGRQYDCIRLEPETDILSYLTPYTRLVALDEAQFFDKLLLADLKLVLKKSIDIVAAGLDKDYKARAFGPVPDLIAMATHAQQLWATCDVCGQPASHTYRKTQNSVLLLIGNNNHYEARCAACFNEGMNSAAR